MAAIEHASNNSTTVAGGNLELQVTVDTPSINTTPTTGGLPSTETEL